MLSFLPHPQKPKGCGKCQDPTLPAFEWKPTNCSFWLCPLEHAIFWTGLDLWEQRSAGTKTEAPRNPCSSHHRRLPAAPDLLTEVDKGSDSYLLGSGEIQTNDTAKKKKKDEEVWCLVPFSVEDVAGSTDISLMWLGALTSHSSLSFFF